MPSSLVCDLKVEFYQLMDKDVLEQKSIWKDLIPKWLELDSNKFWELLWDNIDSIPVGVANAISQGLINAGPRWGNELSKVIISMPSEYARPLARYYIEYPTEEAVMVLEQLAQQASSDSDRVAYLGMGSLIGNVDATIKLLEMEAILGEFTDLGKEVGALLIKVLDNQALEVLKSLLDGGKWSLSRTFAIYLAQYIQLSRNTSNKKFNQTIDNIASLATEYLKNPNSEQSRAAIEVLKVCPRIKAAWLRQACLNKYTYVRSMVQRFIHHNMVSDSVTLDLSMHEIAEIVKEGLQDLSPLVREKAVLALKSVETKDTIPILKYIAYSQYEVVKVRMAAITALAELLDETDFYEFLFKLRDDSRFQIRLFVREVEIELINSEHYMEDELFWGSKYCFCLNDRYRRLDDLLVEWVNLFVGDAYVPEQQENRILENIKSLGQDEDFLRQILDFYIDMEERLFQSRGFSKNSTKIQRFRRILRLWDEESIGALTMILAVERDLSLRLAAIEALSELALNGIEVDEILAILLRHLSKTDNPPDQERVLAALYVFPQETYGGIVQAYLTSRSPRVAAQAASLLASFSGSEISCYNVKRIVEKIFSGVRQRRFLGKLWGDMAVYTARLSSQEEQCGSLGLDNYLQDEDYLVRRFAKEVKYNLHR